MKIVPIKTEVIDHMGTDMSVVNAARVSFHKESKWESKDGFRSLSEQDIKLINYLARYKHFSPFNHCFISSRIKAPIFVARQLVKHKFMPWNEVSRRYVDEEPEFYLPGKGEWRNRAENVKQGSGEKGAKIYAPPQSEDLWGDYDNQFDPDLFVDYHCTLSLELYNNLISGGVAPEQARMILPQNMMTEWVWSGTLGAYADMLRLRLDPHTQYESRIVAQQLYEQILPLFPVSLKALLEN